MRLNTAITIAALVVLTACGSVRDSRLNPFNWFGPSRSVPAERAEAEGEVNPLIPTRSGLFQRRRAQIAIYQGTPIDQISGLVVERVPGGAIIRATGIAAVPGVYSVRLSPEFEGEDLAVDGVLTYRLEGIRPPTARPGGPERIRTVTAARRVTDNELRNVRMIRVEGLRNARETRRR